MGIVGEQGKIFLSHACCTILGFFMVYYVARTEEMILREHFRCQYLGGYLFQSVREGRRGETTLLYFYTDYIFLATL